jgi:hypothetical protein
MVSGETRGPLEAFRVFNSLLVRLTRIARPRDQPRLFRTYDSARCRAYFLLNVSDMFGNTTKRLRV